ncbi:hypothetical protein D3C80_2052950 [compost metagenome]
MRQHLVAAGHIALFLFLQQVGRDIGLAQRVVGQLADLDQLGIADIQQVAQAAQHIVVDHRGHLVGAGRRGKAAIIRSADARRGR